MSSTTTPDPTQGGSRFRTPSSATTASVPPPPPTKPKDPIMGLCLETWTGSGDYYYVFGGMPRAGWNGIKGGVDRAMSDGCIRPVDPVSGLTKSSFLLDLV